MALTVFYHQDYAPGLEQSLGHWEIMLYHLAPLFFAEKPAIALNRNKIFHGEVLGKTIADWLAGLSPGYRVRIFPLGSSGDRVLILFYQPGRLQKALYQPESRKLLAGFGYEWKFDLEADFYHLQSRLKGPFPHEIGIFFGIPAHDVAGFIKNRGKNYLLNGYWKVYEDPAQARKVFFEFNRAKQKMMILLTGGMKFGRLHAE